MILQRGDRVRVVNPKHRHAGKSGVLEKMDRGNVWIVLSSGMRICTRMDALERVSVVDEVAALSSKQKETS